MPPTSMSTCAGPLQRARGPGLGPCRPFRPSLSRLTPPAIAVQRAGLCFHHPNTSRRLQSLYQSRPSCPAEEQAAPINPRFQGCYLASHLSGTIMPNINTAYRTATQPRATYRTHLYSIILVAEWSPHRGPHGQNSALSPHAHCPSSGSPSPAGRPLLGGVTPLCILVSRPLQLCSHRVLQEIMPNLPKSGQAVGRVEAQRTLREPVCECVNDNWPRPGQALRRLWLFAWTALITTNFVSKLSQQRRARCQ